MEVDQVKITKLKNIENWGIWKFQMRVLLTSHEVFDVVNGTISKPTTPGQGATADEETKYEKDLKEFTKKDGVAQKYIVTSMERQPMTHILTCESAEAMWDKLFAIYENKTDVSVHVLQQKWFSFQKDPKDDIATHISKLSDLCYTLRSLKEEISDSMMITKILMTLPSSYNHFRSAWDSAAVDQKTVENLTSRLIMEETRMLSQENTENSAFVAKNQNAQKFANQDGKHAKARQNGRGHNTSGNSNVNKQSQDTCWNCGKAGHKKRNC